MINIRKIELTVRLSSLSFCSFMFFYAFLLVIDQLNLFFILIILTLSFPVARSVQYVSEKVFIKDDELWDDVTEDEKERWLFAYKMTGITILYFLFQISVAFFIQQYYFHHLLNNSAFVVSIALLNCLVICLFYKKYIFHEKE